MGSGHKKSYKISKQALDNDIKLWLKKTSKECMKEQQKRKVERFTLNPSMEILCEAQDMVEKFIEERIILDSKWHTLTVHEKLSLLLFQIHSRANCRVRILLNFGTEELEKYQPGTFICSNDHKTGSVFTNYAYITHFDKNVLNELCTKSMQKNGYEAHFYFHRCQGQLFDNAISDNRQPNEKSFHYYRIQISPKCLPKSLGNLLRQKQGKNPRDTLKKFSNRTLVIPKKQETNIMLPRRLIPTYNN